MAITERLRFLLEADVNDAIRGFEKVGDTADRQLGKAESRSEKLSAGFTKAGAAMLAAGGVAVLGLTKAANAASDLNEAVNLTEITFGDARGAVDEFVKSASSIGQSERAAREATATFGGLLQNLGFTAEAAAQSSIQLTKLASDLGSAFNTDPADAVMALGAALRGETEPIRRYNVMLSDAAVRQKAVEMGLADTTAAVDTHGKAQAALQLILEQTNRYQGDFVNNADAAANAQRVMAAQWEELQAKLGEKALPVMQDVLGVVNQMLGGVMALDDATGGLVGTIATWGTGLLLAGGAISTLIGKVTSADSAIGKLVTRFGAVNVAAGAFAATLGTIAITEMIQGLREGTRTAEGFSQAVVAAGGDIQSALIDKIKGDSTLAKFMKEAGLSVEEVAEKLRLSDSEFEEWIDSVRTAGIESGITAGVMFSLQARLEALRDEVEEAGGALDLLGEKGVDWTRTGRQAAEATEEAAESTSGFRQSVVELTSALDGLLGRLDTREAMRNLAEGFDRIEQAAFDAWLAASTGAADAEKKAREHEDAIDDQIRRIVEYEDALGRLPADAITEIVAMIDEERFAEAERRLAELTGMREFTLTPRLSGLSPASAAVAPRSSSSSSSGGPPIDLSFLERVPAFAEGGIVTRPTLALIGEEGPEAVVPLGRGGFGGVHIAQIIVNNPDPDAVVRAIEEYRTRTGGLPRHWVH